MQEINLYNLLKFYAKNWLLIVSLTLVGLLAGLVYNTFIQVPLYKSSATLLIIDPTADRAVQDVTRINNYIQLFQSRRVIEPVIKDQNIDISYDSFVKSIEATNEKSTEVIKASVSTTNPEKSQNILRGAIDSFKEQIKALYGTDNISIVDNANSAIPPYNVHKELQLALATAVGFVVSLVILFFIYDIKGDGRDKQENKKPKVVKQEVAKPAKVKKVKKPSSRPALMKTAKRMFVGDTSKAQPVIDQSIDASTIAPKKISLKKSTATKKPAKKSTK